MNKRAIGAKYEEMALEYLLRNGVRFVTRNFTCRSGEIDLIVRDGKYLVFVEVKYRTGDRFGSAAEAVSLRKQQRISRAAAFYLRRFGYSFDTPVRFDVITLNAPPGEPVRIQWFQNAFFCHL
ncbi:MAG: YraN family protein [Lachnospiraceae bacterium]|nr:YraN family protein [Lachnospiraceae bacterium]